MTLHRFLALFTLVLIVATGTALWFVPEVGDFQPDNPFWNGSRALSDAVRITPLDSFSELLVSPRGVTLIVIPYRQFDAGELEALDGFVAAGGVLLLADDFGWGNQVLEHLGLGARFSGQALLDPLFHYKSRGLPRVNFVAGDPLTGGLEHLTLNYATILVGVAPDSVLAVSSSFSFLDGNGNGAADPGEPTGQQVVMSRHALGQGQVVLLADPSVFISGMMASGESLGIAENIAAASPNGLYFDRSHLGTSNLRQTKDWLRTLRELATKPPVSVALVVAIIVVTLAPVWYSGSKKRNGQLSPGKE